MYHLQIILLKILSYQEDYLYIPRTDCWGLTIENYFVEPSSRNSKNGLKMSLSNILPHIAVVKLDDSLPCTFELEQCLIFPTGLEIFRLQHHKCVVISYRNIIMTMSFVYIKSLCYLQNIFISESNYWKPIFCSVHKCGW